MRSYFLDTNYILRYLLKDNASQYKEVSDLMEAALLGNVHLESSVVVFFETNWVLGSVYEKSKEERTEYLQDVLDLDLIQFDTLPILIQGLSLYKGCSHSLEDCYNAAYFKHHGLNEFASFDKKLLKTIKKL